MSVLRRIMAVIAGLLAASIVVFAFEWAGMFIHSTPTIDAGDKKAIAEMMNHMPLSAFLWLLLGYCVSSFIGGLTASIISARQSHMPAIIVGAVLTAGGVFNVMSIPHPLWFVIVCSLSYIPFAYLGYIVAKKTVKK